MGLADLFKVNQFKEEIAKLQSDNQQLQQEADKKLSLEAMSADELAKETQRLSSEKDSINNDISDAKSSLESIQADITSLRSKKDTLESQIDVLTDDISVQEYGLYRPQYDFASALEYKDKLKDVRQSQKNMIHAGSAATIIFELTFNNSASKGRAKQKKNIKQLIRSFNVECEAAINKVTYSNIERVQSRIQKSFDQLNKLNDPNGVAITSDYLGSKIDELHLAFEYQEKKEQEKEELREQRQREREDKAVQKEIAAKQKNIDKEISHYSNVVDDLQAELADKDDVEKEELLKQIQELKDKINSYNNQKNELDYRLENSTAGYVYIISNIGSFGDDVVKIGVTRRLNPMDRIDELGSASVPFKFDVHALIFSYDAYKLESELHERFADERINKVNNRKEYFKISIDEIKNVLEEYKDLTVDFNERPEAPEYRQTLALEKK